ncbi:type IV pilin protein [Desulfosoma caldarium]|uniref:Type IV pilus assembly protein PilE n=1 Tax=Desulfosoma caldarium TaxID=610254 RepID=A0A3N1VGH8_9BACT|nr:type IV pilin protein [Desulfosoma caldarium]ROR01934.1 type IV pilus assembly protein PilE [Desulfosoma caldarium]
MEAREGRRHRSIVKCGTKGVLWVRPMEAPCGQFRPHEGFTLVELMVTVAILAILAGVAVPAYIHSVRRSEQAQAVEALLRARMEMEAFWADHNRYAGTLNRLPSFENPSQGKYTLSLKTSPDGQRYRIEAVRSDLGDKLHISDNETTPVVDTPKALGWSLFHWVFAGK